MGLRDVLLNDRQLEVLTWIADGCPDGVMVGHAHKQPANALRNRRLITVSKRQGVWAAELTDDGRYYLEHNTYPPPPKRRSPAPTMVKATPTDPNGAPAYSAQPLTVRPRSTAAPPKPPRPSGPARQLIADLEAAGGELLVERDASGGSYDARLRAAIRYRMVPEGKLLTIDGWPTSQQRTIRLEDKPDWMTAQLAPVPVPAQLRNPHKAVVTLQKKGSVLYVDDKVRARALRIVEALAVEATRRGQVVKAVKITRDACGYRRIGTKDTFTVNANGHEIGIQIQQINDRVPHVPTQRQLASAAKSSWEWIPKHDTVPSDRLKITLSGRFEHRQSTWADSKTRSVDDVLAEILQEIELRAAAAERERLEKIAAADQQRREWEQAIAQAKIDYRESKRAMILTHQAAAWEQSRRLNAYIAAMETTLDSATDPETSAATREWIDWARKHAEELDPLKKRLSLPQPHEPEPTALEPFLHGHSPYGPRDAWPR